MTDRVQWRLVAIAIALAMLSAACGGSDADDAADQNEAETDAVASADDGADEAEPDDEDEPEPHQEEAAFPRTIAPGLGETTIPTEPERVVALFGEILGEELLALGIEPVGALPYMSPLPATGETYGLEVLYDVEPIGQGFEPNIELIAALQPDLIISDNGFFEGLYEPLSGIAPTVAFDVFADDWQANFRTVAEAVGREERAEEVIAEYDARVAELAPTVEERFGDRSVAVVQANLGNEQGAAGTVRIYGIDTNPGRFLADLGIQVWEPADPGGSEIAPSTFEVSAETVPDIDADHILYLIEPVRFAEPATIEADPLWQSTPAAAGELLFLDFGTQVRLGGPLHKFVALDAVEALLGGVDAGGVTVPESEEPEAAAGGTVGPVAAAAGGGAVAGYSAFAPGFAEAIQADGPVTALIPNDEALAALSAAEPELTGQLQADFDLLDQALLYHVIEGELTAEALAGVTELTTLQGETITVAVDGDEIVLNDGQARVIEVDLLADNGVVHIIDGVLLPPSLAG
ncbi:MAG: ABC transporter substrate-binding protein [Actinomycetota bacterium]